MELLHKLLAEIVEATGMIIGAGLAILGGIAATWYRARKTRTIRKTQLICERQMNVATETYKLIIQFRLVLNGDKKQEALNWIDQKEDWFFATALFHPGRFATKWKSAQSYLRTAVTWEATLQKYQEDTPSKHIKQCQREKYKNNIEENMNHARNFADQALDEVYKYIEIQPITVEKPSNLE